MPGVRDSSLCWVEGGLPQFGKREFGVYGSELARKCELLAFVPTFSGHHYYHHHHHHHVPHHHLRHIPIDAMPS